MPRTIGDALEWHAKNAPNKVAVVGPDRSLTYAELWQEACRLANGLRQLGVRPGDRVATLMTNSATYLVTYQALGILGAAAVPLNFRFVASEIEYVVNHSKSAALIVDAAFQDIVGSLDGKLPTLGKNVVVVGEPVRQGWIGYTQLLAGASPSKPDVAADLDECYFQGYTAGTTGFPKGCVNPHRGFVDFFKRLAIVYRITENDVEIVPAPLFHEAPTLYALLQLFVGGTVVTTSDTTPKAILEIIARNRTTWGFMVPTMWDALAASEEIKRADVSSMRLLVSAGAPLLTHTKEALISLFPAAGLNEFYGGTEVGVVTNLGPEDQKRKIRCVGRPILGFDVKLLDENRQEVPSGEVGEIFIKGPILIREYYENPEATSSARHGDRFSLGDLGRLDEEGYLYIVDRKKDMIITGGENVFPAEIEAALHRHPAVAMTAVVGVPDARWGETVLAEVVLKPGSSITNDELMEHCRAHLANFKVPRLIKFVSALPMSSFGKILRREVRRPYWEKHQEKV